MRWITRSHVHVDRVACPWLIRRFVDSQAEFMFVPASQVMELAATFKATPFDAGGKAQPLDHHDGLCTFEAIIEHYGLSYPALKLMGQIVHGADIADAGGKHQVSDGLEALAVGYSLLFPDDLQNLEAQFTLYDALYAWCRLQTQSAR
jgi:hypothetical protein